jgi:hypothetical protein
MKATSFPFNSPIMNAAPAPEASAGSPPPMTIGAAKTAGTKVERMRRVVVMLLKKCIVWSDLKIEFGERVWSKSICRSDVSG